jgi:hypothetical protein
MAKVLLLFCILAAATAQSCCCLPAGSLPGDACLTVGSRDLCLLAGGSCSDPAPLPTAAPTTLRPTPLPTAAPTTPQLTACACVVAPSPGQCWCQFAPGSALPVQPSECAAAGFLCLAENPATQDFLGDCYPEVPTTLCETARGTCSASACVASDQPTCCCLLAGSRRCQPDTSAEWCASFDGQCEGAPVVLAAIAPAVTCLCVPPSASERVQPREVPACAASGGRCRLPAADLTFDGRVDISDLANLLVQYGNEV